MICARYMLLLLLGSFFAVLGVAQRTRVLHLGYRISRLEAERDRHSENVRQLLCQISALSQPQRVAAEVERLNIALLNPVELTTALAGDVAGVHLHVARTPRR